MNLEELTEKLSKCELKPTWIDGCTYVFDGSKFVESHVRYLKKNSGNKTFKPYFDRLKKYYEQLQRIEKN